MASTDPSPAHPRPRTPERRDRAPAPGRPRGCGLRVLRHGAGAVR